MSSMAGTIGYNRFAVSVEETESEYVITRFWKNGNDIVALQRYRAPLEVENGMVTTTLGPCHPSSLEHDWSITDNSNETTVAFTWKKDGEIVRRSVHVFLKQGHEAVGAAASFQ